MFKTVALVTGAAFVFAAHLAAALQQEKPAPGQKSAQTMNKAASGQAESFIKKTGENGVAEVDLAHFASAKATDPQVKAFAEMLASDHSKANDELMAMAKTKNVTVATEVTAPHKATKDKLDKLSGVAFDKAYVNDMLRAHQNAIREFEQASKSSDPDVKAFADKTLPTLRHHLEEAQRLAKSVGTASPGKGGARPAPNGSGKANTVR